MGIARKRPLALVMALVSVGALLCLAVLARVLVGNLSRDEALSGAETAARGIVHATDSFFEGYWIAFEAMAEIDEIRRKDGTASDRLFARLLKGRPEFENVAAVGPDGVFFGSSKPFDRLAPPGIAGQAFFKRTVDGSPRVVMEPHRGPISGLPVTGAAVRLANADGSHAGLLGASIKMERLVESWKTSFRRKELGVVIVSGDQELYADGQLAEAARRGTAPAGGALVRFDLAPFPGTGVVVAGPAVDLAGYFSANPLSLASGLALLAALGALLALAFLEDRRSEALARSLKEKQLLMAELHHRVRTSISLIHALLGFARDSGGTTRALLDSARRQAWVVALAHGTLYESGELERLDVGAFLRGIAAAIRKDRAREDVELELYAAEARLHIDDALPLGIAVAELADNAFAHAFPSGRGGTVSLGLEPVAGGGLRLRLADNGVGMDAGTEREGLGLFVTRLLASQLGGEVRFEAPVGGGSVWILDFRPRK